jgi:hypothetical protein
MAILFAVGGAPAEKDSGPVLIAAVVWLVLAIVFYALAGEPL